MAHLYHAPADCPVCGDSLIVTRKGCRTCGSELAGEFESCVYCGLASSDLDLLRVFLSSRGNLREVEKHLGVSYPTARARLDAVVDKLGFTSSPEQPPREEGSAEETGEQLTPRQQVLERVATGEISAETAATLLANL